MPSPWTVSAARAAPIIEAAVRSAMARAREIDATSVAFPALGTGVGGFPLEDAARITVDTVRDELERSPNIEHVIFALRGAAAYEAFGAAMAPRSGRARSGTQARRERRRVNLEMEPTEEQRDELIETVAREIQLRGLTSSAVHFLEASRPYRALGANAMLFFDPVLRGVFGGELASASEIMADETGIELLIARLEELDEELAWDA